MTVIDPLDEQRAIKLRQRLWGAAVLIALAVIFLPLMLDGSGSESQYRRVERLREEPPRIIDSAGNVEPQPVIETQRRELVEKRTPAVGEEPANIPQTAEPIAAEQLTDARSAAPQNAQQRSAATTHSSLSREEGISAWVVQAGSFGDAANAIAVRDRLRRAGFPSFVTPSVDGLLHRVRVGPMISEGQAIATKDKVVSLLQRDAIVVRYP